MTTAKKIERVNAVNRLRGMLKPGDTVTTTVLHVSRSGMSRVILCQLVNNGQIMDASYLVARAIDSRLDNTHGGVVASGCGMDMRFSVVYSLGRVLFPDGFGVAGHMPDARRKDGMRPVRARTPSEAARMVKQGAIFRGRNGNGSGWDTDGGYTLDYR